MSMTIGNNYSNYTRDYASPANTGNRTTAAKETEAAKETAKTAQTTSARKTAADELAYLSKKYEGYSFVGANYSMGMRYGSNSTTNVAISPQFLAKMANDPELEKEYEENIAAMKELDEQFVRSVEAGGWHVVAKGWFIDKDGGIGGWCITQKDDSKSQLEKMNEKAEKIREENKAKKEEKAELEEKRAAAKEEKEEQAEKVEKTDKHGKSEKIELRGKTEKLCRKRFGDKFKGAVIIDKDEENGVNVGADNEDDKNGSEAVIASLDIRA